MMDRQKHVDVMSHPTRVVTVTNGLYGFLVRSRDSSQAAFAIAFRVFPVQWLQKSNVARQSQRTLNDDRVYGGPKNPSMAPYPW